VGLSVFIGLIVTISRAQKTQILYLIYIPKVGMEGKNINNGRTYKSHCSFALGIKYASTCIG